MGLTAAYNPNKTLGAPTMKNKLILTLALSVLATGAFAEDGFDNTNAHRFS